MPPRRIANFTLLIAIVLARISAAQVTLPLERYEELRRRSLAGVPEAQKPAAPFALEQADFEVRVTGAGARIVQTLRLAIFDDGFVAVPVAAAGSFVSADFGDLAGRVEAGADPHSWTLVVRGAGRHVVRLESAATVDSDVSATRLTRRLPLPMPRAALVRGGIVVPAEVAEVELEGPGLVWRSPAGASATRFEFAARPGEQVTLVFLGAATVAERGTLPLRFQATSAVSATLSRTQLRLRAWLRARVFEGSLQELRLPLPAGFEVAMVSGGHAGWSVSDSHLLVTPTAPVERDWQLEIELLGTPSAEYSCPSLAPEGSARTTSLCRFEVKGDGLGSLAAAESGRVADGSETALLPAAWQALGRWYTVRDSALAPRFAVSWADATEVLAAQVTRLYVEVATGRAGRASYRVWAQVENRGAQDLRFVFPPGFELTAAAREQVPVRAGRAGDEWVVPLAASEKSQLVHVAGVLPLTLPERGRWELVLPRLSAPVARVEVRAILPAGPTYALVDSTRAFWVGAPPTSAGPAPAAANASQVAIYGALRRETFESALSNPPGFAILGAAWNALSAQPAPLLLEITAKKESTLWF